MIACVRISYGSLWVRESFLSYRSMEDKKELARNANYVSKCWCHAQNPKFCEFCYGYNVPEIYFSPNNLHHSHYQSAYR